ncbi:hypothetical protein QL285_084595 [Trifolium repens]|nr:hypothetical protein QL285_084595 [Trifolium repens]
MCRLVNMRMYKSCGKCYTKQKPMLYTIAISARSGESFYGPPPTIVVKLHYNLQITINPAHLQQSVTQLILSLPSLLQGPNSINKIISCSSLTSETVTQ